MASKLGSLLRTKIRTSGPVSVAEYMRTCLTDPNLGYYVHGNPIGRTGDFTTAPEISQIFGELVSIWCIYEWQRAGFVAKHPKLRIVELGPGKGTLSSDILRTVVQTMRNAKATPIDTLKTGVELHLVEVSKQLSEAQRSTLCVSQPKEAAASKKTDSAVSKFESIPVFWHQTVDEALIQLRSSQAPGQSCFDVFVANEFFDALPIHKFENVAADATKSQVKDFRMSDWRELHVDCHPDGRFQLVKTPNLTPSCAYLNYVQIGNRRHVEISVESGRIVQQIATYLAKRSGREGAGAGAGACLIVDYGHHGEKEDTLRGFREHKVCAPFDHEPGECDLTVDVDFAFLKQQVDALRCSVQTFDAIEQRYFLANLGIGYRLQRLLQNVRDPDTRKKLIGSVQRIMDEEMGARFKVFAFTTNADRQTGPAGFIQPA